MTVSNVVMYTLFKFNLPAEKLLKYYQFLIGGKHLLEPMQNKGKQVHEIESYCPKIKSSE
jgi:hypothetical protein